MEVEVQSVAKEHKTKLQIKLRSYKSDIARYKADVVSLLCSPAKRALAYLSWTLADDNVLLPFRRLRNHCAPQAIETTCSVAGTERTHPLEI